mmetsp:Transcript_156846/g.277021  ORF Transcript_156846/g.277021 Transcript_156846/m.277021 type:complete len:384 (-) Transcript_156846:273-1424(-)
MTSRLRLARTESEVRTVGVGQAGRQRRAFPVTGGRPAHQTESPQSVTPSPTDQADPASPSAASHGTGVPRTKAIRPPAQLTKEVLLACTSVIRKKGENDDNFLRRLTHLQLQGLRLGPALTKLQLVTGVCVLYVYDNLISSLEGFENLRRLQQLYLQNNRLTSLVGLEGLTNLKKLHAGNNAILKIDGLAGCHSLEELHVPNQRLPADFALQFCPETIVSLASSLLVLNAASNYIQDAVCLEPLHNLQTLDLADNELQQMQNVSALLAGAPGLVRLQLRGNRLAIQERRYRHTVVLLASAIEEIDGTAVLPQERDFVRRLEDQKRKRQALRDRHLAQCHLGKAGFSQVGVTASTGPDAVALSRSGKAGLDLSAAPPVLQDLVH